jgi:hypothetical protein
MHPYLCRATAEAIAEALHGDRDYDHRPFADRAYDIIVAAGKEHKLTLRTARECAVVLPETA